MANPGKQGTGILLVKLSAPAHRALAGAGISTLKELSRFTEEEIAKLHGIGNNGLQQLSKALAENGLSFARKK
jgi:DNA-directed RNA polymerase alpha subunit